MTFVSDVWHDRPIITNTFFGLEYPRPISPLVHLVCASLVESGEANDRDPLVDDSLECGRLGQ